MKEYFFQRTIADHDVIKNKLLPLIKTSPQLLVNESQGYFATDYVVSLELVRDWYEVAYPIIHEHLHFFQTNYNFTGTEIKSLWFQDYPINGFHVPHVHPSCHFTNVWYLNFPSKSATTQIFDPITKNVIDVDVNEGDILTFPSFIMHESAKVDQEKTIISFNVNIV